MIEKILIIKKGASGDVIRTSVLLHFLQGEITWVTTRYNKVLLPQHHSNLKTILSVEEAQQQLPGVFFDKVICLDDDLECAKLASSVKTNEQCGIYLQDNKIVYANNFKEWFDMGLSSRFGKKRADELKWLNRKIYQQILFEGFNKKFNNHPYLLNEEIKSKSINNRVGLEVRAGDRWPTKSWNKFDELAVQLKQKGLEPYFFKQRNSLTEFMNDVATCHYVVTGDTLTMHIALALKIPQVTIFTCTSPWEICDYGIMQKVVSPELERAFYKTDYIPEAVNSIRVEYVINAFEKLQM